MAQTSDQHLTAREYIKSIRQLRLDILRKIEAREQYLHLRGPDGESLTSAQLANWEPQEELADG